MSMCHAACCQNKAIEGSLYCRSCNQETTVRPLLLPPPCISGSVNVQMKYWKDVAEYWKSESDRWKREAEKWKREVDARRG
jgi:hypothetical protein